MEVKQLMVTEQPEHAAAGRGGGRMGGGQCSESWVKFRCARTVSGAVAMINTERYKERRGFESFHHEEVINVEE